MTWWGPSGNGYKYVNEGKKQTVVNVTTTVKVKVNANLHERTIINFSD